MTDATRYDLKDPNYVPGVFVAITPVVEAIQFTTLDSYMAICAWARGKTGTLSVAATFQFKTPIMLVNSREGMQAAAPGDWVVTDQPNRGNWWVWTPAAFGAYRQVEDVNVNYGD